MKKILILICSVILTPSCGLVSKYQNAQHSVYASMLTEAEKDQINREGEITKEIELIDESDNGLLKGTLRIMKTEDPTIFNFIEIGKWVEHGRLGSSGKYNNMPYKDTTLNDASGNSLWRVVYHQENSTEYTLIERWTINQTGKYPVRHVEAFNNNVLVSEFDLKLTDFEKSKSDIQKKKVKTGVQKDYSKKGQLISTKTYDDSGKLIKEEKSLK